MIKLIQKITLLLMFTSGASAQAEFSWLNAPHWEEGLAEVCIYGGQEKRYGIMRNSRVELVTVREFFDPEKNVKAGAGEGEHTVPVLKQNWTRHTRTGVYEYIQMASVFLRRDSGALQKMNMSSMEWCGNSSALVEANDAGGLDYSVHSYFDDMGKESGQLKQSDILLHEALLPYLRENLTTLKAGTPLRLAKPLLSNKPALGFYNRGSILGVEKLYYPWNGNVYPCIKVLVSTDTVENRETFIITDDDQRRMLAWEGRGGEYLKLYKVMFMDYWNKTKPGDEALLK